MEQFLDLDFPSISVDAWVSKATADLKGRSPDTLATPIEDGISLPPYPGPESVLHVPEFGFARQGRGWLYCQEIPSLKDLPASRNAGISLPLVQLTKDTFPDEPITGPLVLVLPSPDMLTSSSFQFENIGGTCFIRFENGAMPTAEQAISACRKHPGLRPVCIDVSGFFELGANYSQQLALALGRATEILDSYTDAGCTPADVAGMLWFQFAAGTDFLAECAKFRAFRQGYATWLEASGLTYSEFPALVFGSAGISPLSMLDRHTNLLRQTTTALSMVCGGCDIIAIPAFDTLHGQSGAGTVLARNISLIMEHEGRTGQVSDPLGGSYAVEYLTHAFATKAWSTFLDIQNSGGFTKYVQSQAFHQSLEDTLQARHQALSLRRHVRVGVNQYPNLMEELEVPLTLPAIQREARPFEQLRFRMERHVSEGGQRFRVFLFTFGNLAMRKARANFAYDLFGLTGCSIEEAPEGTASPEDFRAMQAYQPDIVVFCSSDEEYLTMLPELVPQVPESSITVLAGKPADTSSLERIGIRHFVYQRMDTLSFLNQVLTKGGVA